MGDRLAGRVAVVTGSGQGIGRGIARRFAREGCNVVVAEINDETGLRVVEELKQLGVEAVFVKTDVKNEAQARACVAAAVETWGRVDIVVNNAWGGGVTTRLEWTENEALIHGFEMGLMAAFWTMQEAFPHMKEQGGGSIINIASLNGVNSHVFTNGYNTGKEAMRTLTRNAAVEWGRWNIRSNVICPGAATEAYVEFATANPETAAKMLEDNPMRRMGDPENDIGGAALFLASDDSAYVNGNTLMVGGGTHINGVSWRPVMPEERP